MDYLICIFLLGCIVTFVVIVGLARAAEFARTDSSQHLQIDPLPADFNLVQKAAADYPVPSDQPEVSSASGTRT